MSQSCEQSQRLFREAQQLIPGGVNSPVRAFKAVGGGPRFMARGAGARVWDVDGNEYLDCVGSWGPLILGHARREVVEAACQAAWRGTTFGAPTELEVSLARAIV
jgi:glutamate-1-semialdehyde 2,1-aminomutase